MILPTIITVFGSVLVASLTFYLTKRQSLAAQWRQEKINHYKVLFSSLSGMVEKGEDYEDARKNWTLAFNTIALVAPQYVITPLMDYFEYTKGSNPNQSSAHHDELLRKLLLAVRKDIGLTKKDNENSFNYHLISRNPQPR